MAMRTASPWWVSLAFGVGLFFILLGERLFGSFGGYRSALTAIGLIIAVGATGLRAWAVYGTTGARRGVERTLLACMLGALFALVLYTLTTKWGLGHFKFTEKGAAKFETAVTVLWSIVMLGSLVPLFMIEVTLGIPMRTAFDLKGSVGDGAVESFRVRDIGWAGLTVALAASFLMVTCNVASERNIVRDVSYFKTSSPGDSTKAIVEHSKDPIKVMLFFPPGANEVKDQARGYFEALSDAVPGHLEIEEHDRLSEAKIAEACKVTGQANDTGMVVLARGEVTEKACGTKLCGAVPCTIDLGTDLEKARRSSGKLRNLDHEVNSKLIQLARDKRKLYLVAGHGELNDPESIPADKKAHFGDRHTVVLKKHLGDLNYEVKDLTLMDMAKDIPQDASVVLLLAPTQALQDAEWATLQRYIDRGGRLMIALDPESEPSLGPFENAWGLKFNPAPVTDDEPGHYIQSPHPSIADRRFTITNNFSAHPSTTTLSRSGGKGAYVIESGSLDEVPTTGKGEQPKKTITIRSMDSAWLDLNNNFKFDDNLEKRGKYNIAAAVEGPKVKVKEKVKEKDKDGKETEKEVDKEKDGWRALVFADANFFRDIPIGQGMVAMVGGPLLDDSVKWLGGDEAFVGEVVSEDDKQIEHTKSQDAKWFLMTIIGAPLVVLGIGIGGTRLARRRSRKNEGSKS